MKRLSLLLALWAAPASAEPFKVMLDWFVNPDHGPERWFGSSEQVPGTF